MATAADMLIGTGPQGARGAPVNAASNARAARLDQTVLSSGTSPLTPDMPSAMESFAAALRSSVSSQALTSTATPGVSAELAAMNAGRDLGDLNLGDMNITVSANTPFAQALANLPGVTSHLDENGNMVFGQLPRDPEALNSLMPGLAARLSEMHSPMAGTAPEGGDFAGRIAAIGMIDLPLTTFNMADAMDTGAFPTHSPIAQILQQAKDLGIDLGPVFTAENAANDPNAASPELAAFLDHAKSGALDLPPAALTVLENGGSILEFRQALLGGLVRHHGSGTGDGSLGNDGPAQLGQAASENFGVDPTQILTGANNQAPQINPSMAGQPTGGALESAPDGRQTILADGQPHNPSGPRSATAPFASTDPSAATQGGLTAERNSAIAHPAPVAPNPSAGPASDGSAIASASNSATTNTSPSTASGTPIVAAAASTEAPASKAAPLHGNDGLQKATLGQIITQIRSGEITPEAAREALTLSGRSNLVQHLPIARMASGINVPGENASANVSPNAATNAQTTGAIPASERLAAAGTPANPVAEIASGAEKTSGTPLADQTNTAKASPETTALRNSQAETKAPVVAAFNKAQSGDTPIDRPVISEKSFTKTQAELIKEAATQFAKSGVNPATVATGSAANPALNASAANSGPQNTAPLDTAASNMAPVVNTPLDADFDVAQPVARPLGDANIEPRMSDRPATPAPLSTPQSTEAAQTLDRPEAVRERATEVRGAMRFDTATRAAAVQDMSVALTRFAGQGLSRFQIRLDPVELGRIEVKLDIAADGKTTAHITVERPETLDMMRNDARTLERALQDAGLKTDQNSMNFSLKDQDGEARHGDAHDAAPEWAQGAEQDEASREETIQLAVSMDETIDGLRIMGARGIDVRI